MRVSVCAYMHEWCVGRAMNGQRGVCSHRHHSSSETRNAIYSSARPYWEKEEGIRWVWISALSLFCADRCACSFSRCIDLPFLCHSHHSFSLPICLSLHFCSWLNALCRLEINLFMSSFMYFHSDRALTLSLGFFFNVIYCLQYSTKG